jgi:Zn-finger protein
MQIRKGLKIKEKKARFFSHTECEYFPCHPTDEPEAFNCLFCYCPLYVLGDECGGDFTYNSKGTKDCSGCLRPHKKDFYKVIMKRFPEIAVIARKKGDLQK